MAARQFSPIFGKRLRITTLDKCGNVPASEAADSVAVTGGFITIQFSAEVEDGVEIVTKRADGAFCVNFKDRNSFKRLNVEVEFCGVDPSILALTSNAEAYDDYSSDPNGFVLPEGKIEKQFALELWTGIDGACTTDDEEYGYVLLPYVAAGTLSDFSVDGENAVNMTLTGAYTMQNAWGVGPYNVLPNTAGAPDPLPLALDPKDHFLMIPTTVTPPDEVVGLQQFTPEEPSTTTTTTTTE